MRRRSLPQNTAILTLAGLFNRLTGLVYQVILVRLLGAEGVGLIQLIVPIYILGTTAASLGLPIALSKLVAERTSERRWREIFLLRRLSIIATLAGGLTAATVIWSWAPFIAERILTDPRATSLLRLAVFGMALNAVSWTLKGFFQGQEDMWPSAKAQLGEQVVRVGTAIPLVYLLLPQGLERAAFGAIVGTVAGEVAAFLLLFREDRGLKRQPVPWQAEPGTAPGQAARHLFGLGMPLMADHVLYSVKRTLDATLIPRRLQLGGASQAAATAAFGRFAGIAQPLLFLPSFLIFSIGTSLLPTVSATEGRHGGARLRHRINRASRWALVISLVAAAVLVPGAPLIATYVYGEPAAAPLISVLGLAAPCMYWSAIAEAALNGLGHTSAVFVHNCLATGVRVILLWYLVPMAGIGVVGACLAALADMVLAALLHARFLRKATGWHWSGLLQGT